MGRRSSWTEIRYGLARMRSLGRPVFWLPSMLLLLLMLFTWEFWQHPEGLNSFGPTAEGDDSLSREEQAAGLDLDSSTFLMSEIGRSSKPKAQNKLLLQEILSNSVPPQPLVPSQNQISQSQISSVQSDPQGFNPSNPASLAGDLAVGNGQSSGSMARSSLETQATSTALPPNQLQVALDRLMANSPTAVSQAVPIEGTTRLNNSAVNGASSSMSVNSYTTLVEGARSIPPMSDLSAGTSASIGLPSPVVQPAMVAQPLPTQSFDTAPTSQPIAQPEVTTVNPQPFTAPRSVPGRYIGGGNINTFSNP